LHLVGDLFELGENIQNVKNENFCKMNYI